MYTSNLDHLLAELEIIDLMVQYQVIRFRHFHERADEFRGLYISRDEVDALLSGRQIAPTWDREPHDEEFRRLAEAIERRRAEVDERTQASLAEGPLRLPWLNAAFQLSWFEVEALLIALAPEVDSRYERLYAYLQNDVTRRRPTVGLILDLLCSSVAEKMQARASFIGRSRLPRYRLVTVAGDPQEPAHLPSRAVKIDDRIADFLLGGDSGDPRLMPFLSRSQDGSDLEHLILPGEIRERLQALTSRLSGSADLSRSTGAPLCVMVGQDGSGRRSAAHAVCTSLGLGILVLAADRLLTAPNAGDVAALAAREARLVNAALYIDRFETLLGDDPRGAQVRDALMPELAEFEGLGFVATEVAWEPPEILASRRLLRLEFTPPSYALRREAWTQVLGRDEIDLETVASRFRFTPGRIHRTAELAREEAWLSGNGEPSSVEIMRAARALTTLRLGASAQKIQPRRVWGDLVLPSDSLAQLRELCAAVQGRERVFGAWGFERKLSMGKGLNVLFAGPSGTGKTLAAEIIAGELGLDLYRIDLSSVVSKYIGETEKNLSRIFAEAQKSSVVLFFDEADALFGKRSEVKDAHDRYANIETAYLLQRMEEYDGIAILATNLRQNIDEAFLRRLHATVEFPFPDEAYRERIWRTVFPSETPLADEIDFAFLARAFHFAGGNIKNVAVTAAFMGAADGRVRMSHLVRAARRELIKMGHPVLAADFGPYFALLADDAEARVSLEPLTAEHRE